METWKPVVGWEGLYEVSDQGQVRSRRGVRKTSRMPNGYERLTLRRSGKPHVTGLVHCLVAEAFIPRSAPDLEVNHKNNVRHDNRATNLEWVTRKQNNLHAWKQGRLYQQKVTPDKLEQIIHLYTVVGLTQKDVAIQLGISQSLVSHLLRSRAGIYHG